MPAHDHEFCSWRLLGRVCLEQGGLIAGSSEFCQPDRVPTEGVTERSKKGGNKPKVEPKPAMVNQSPKKT